jgi:hypothetical protein
MPMYEYVSEQDGTRLELLRPMSHTDHLSKSCVM